MITEGDQLLIKCTIQVTHLVQAFPEIIIQKDKVIVAHSRHGNEATYSVMAMVEHSGNYTCKVEASRISKVSSIVVNITGRAALGGVGIWQVEKWPCWNPGWPVRADASTPACLNECFRAQAGCLRRRVLAE